MSRIHPVTPFWRLVVTRLTALGVLLALAACTHPGFRPAGKYKPVKVEFDASGCPTKAVPSNVVLKRGSGEGVEWESSSPGVDFDVYFDPFTTHSTAFAKESGRVRSGPISDRAPATKGGVRYKYTIAGARCAAKPLDPIVTVVN